jgi:hypothetical protein
MKIEGSGSESGSGSICQSHGSADPDPDPHQNVMDPQHWFLDDVLSMLLNLLRNNTENGRNKMETLTGTPTHRVVCILYNCFMISIYVTVLN